MPKFNRPIPARTPDTVTAEGGPGFSRDAHDELFALGLANMVGEDTFYESGKSRDSRFEALIHELTATDPDWVRAYIGWLRTAGNMRSAPIVATVEYIMAGGPHGRQLVASVLQRPDEPGEMLGYWGTHGGKVRRPPKPIARGIADALVRLYTERNTLRYDGAGNPIRFGDVVEIVHPAGRVIDAHQDVLYRHLIDRRHNRDDMPPEALQTLRADRMLLALAPEERRAHLPRAIETGWSWERLGGWLPGGMDREAWEAVIPNMGLMALVRNLRNFDKVGVSDQVALEVTRRFMDAEEVRKSRQFPLRFLTAWKAISSVRWGMGLEAAIQHSLANVPSLPGRTLVLIDVSPSMRDYALSRRTDGKADASVGPRRWEVAGIFGAALAQRAHDATTVLFDFDPVATFKVSTAESVMRVVEQCGEWANKSNGTDILSSLARTYDGHDRVVIITDEQNGYQQQGWRYSNAPDHVMGGWDDVANVRCPVFTFNLAGYKVGVTPNERNWHTFGGLTDACFGLIPILERRRAGGWPWDEPAPVSQPSGAQVP